MMQSQSSFIERLKELAKGVQKGANVFPHYLACVLIERDNNRIFGRTFNGYAHQKILIGGDVGKNVRIAIEPGALLKAIAALKGDITLELVDKDFQVIVSDESSKVVIFGEDGGSFFTLPDTGSLLTLANGSALAGIDACAHAISDDPLRPQLNAMFVCDTEAVATDGRMASLLTFDQPLGLDREILLPKSSMDIVLSAISDKSAVSVSHNYIVVEDDETYVACLLVDDKYPNYKAVLPDSSEWPSFLLERKEFVRVLKSAQSLADEVTNATELWLSENTLTVKVASGRGTADYSLIATIPEALYGIRLRGALDYFIQSANTIDTDEIEIRVEPGLAKQVRILPAVNDARVENTVVLMILD